MHMQWKHGQVSGVEYRGVVQLHKDGVRMTKAKLELNMTRDAKSQKRGFYEYVSQKRKVRRSIFPLPFPNPDKQGW